mmetsp:Transcript_13297/g.17417  ORF Transcript_13297/g.17417 Transcript_13297/m.17417 type:complete len:519 (-) Transcript_13297:113-1669(-)
MIGGTNPYKQKSTKSPFLESASSNFFLSFPILYTILCYLIYLCLFQSQYISNASFNASLSNSNAVYVSKEEKTKEKSRMERRINNFPLSIRNENDHEEIQHPGNPNLSMTVPKFWVPPITLPYAGERLMTRDEALSIGSTVLKDDGVEYETVFVMIASYRDYQCPETVRSIFERAKHPERVRVGVVDQMDEASGELPCGAPVGGCRGGENEQNVLCKYRNQIDTYEMEDELAVGPCFARHVGNRMYRGEYYAMQVDAHVTFVQDWDVDVIGQIKATKNEMAVLTTYLSDVQGSLDVNGYSTRKTRPIMCNTQYEGNQQGIFLRHNSQPEARSIVKGSPQMEPYWAAGFSFSRGHFVVNVPYDQYLPMIFLGEEMSIGLRGFTYGYDMYANEKSICFHSYAIGENARKRNKVKHFWEHSNMYKGVGKKAMNRVLGVVKMNPEVPESAWDHTDLDKYGVGKVRELQKFYKTFGIDVVNKHAATNLCEFVQNEMHGLFSEHLRDDGMGVNYDNISFELKEK